MHSGQEHDTKISSLHLDSMTYRAPLHVPIPQHKLSHAAAFNIFNCWRFFDLCKQFDPWLDITAHSPRSKSLLMSFWSQSTESEYIILYHLLLGLGQKHQCRAQKATATHCKTTWGVHTANICKCNLEALLSEPEALVPGPPAISCCTAGCFASDLHLGDVFKTALRHFRSFSVC